MRYKLLSFPLLAFLLFGIVNVALADPSDDITDTVEVTGYKSDTLPFDPLVGAMEESNNREESVFSKIKVYSISMVQLNKADPLSVVLSIINIALSLLASAFLVLLLYAGFLWVWARGNTETIEKAKKLIIQGVIGLVIILGALGIAQLVFFVIGLAV